MKKIILFLLLFCTVSHGAITFIQSEAFSESVNKFNYVSPVTSGSLLFCVTQTGQPSSITDNMGNKWMLYKRNVSQYVDICIYIAVAKQSGYDTILFGDNKRNVIISEYSGSMLSKTSLNTGFTITNSGTDNAIMGTMYGNVNDIACSYVYDASRFVNYQQGSGFTLRDYTTWINAFYFEDFLYISSANKNITWTASDSGKTFVGLSFILSEKTPIIDSLVFIVKNDSGINLHYTKILDSDNDKIINNSVISIDSGYSFLKWDSRGENVIISDSFNVNSDFYLYGSDTIDVYVVREPNKNPWPLEVLTWDVDKAYPGIEYNFRLGVRGGEYPYAFTLQHGPTGMIINKTTGEILWTPESATLDSVKIKIVDQKGDSLIHKYNIEATTSGFYFVDSAAGSNSNDGSEAHPWATMAYASATADSVGFVYVKTGTYNESFSINNNNCGRFIAYPGDSVIVVAPAAININGGSKRLFQGFTFDGNDRKWFFSVGGGGYVKDMIFRKNIFYNIFDNTNENPAGIFFWGGSNNPVVGQEGYKNIVVQDNVFHDIRSTGQLGSSVTCFDVQDLLYEDNKVYDIDGRGVNDKDMGYMNTYRNNVIHHCNIGVGIMCQGGGAEVDICYNHIYSCTTSISLAASGYLHDAYIYHNNALSKVEFGGSFIDTNSYNINIFNNIIGHGSLYAYELPLKRVETPSPHYIPSIYFTNPDSSKSLIDNNIINANCDYMLGPGWGVADGSFEYWISYGYDLNSICTTSLSLDTNNIPILLDSLKIYGAFKEAPNITAQPQSNTVKSGETASFSVTATGSGLTYQWYGNNTLIDGATSSTYSFTAAKIYNGTQVWCLLTTDTTISTDTAVLTVTDMTIDHTTDSLILNIPFDSLFTGQQWYEHDTAITGATALRFVVEADSAAYAKKNYYYCKVWNSVSDTIQSGTWQLGLQPSGTKQKRWFGFKTGAFIGAWR